MAAGPLRETCRFSTSPKSRLRPRAAFPAALNMTLSRAERGAMKESGSGSAGGVGGESGEGGAGGSVLGSFHVAGVGGVHPHLGACLVLWRLLDSVLVLQPPLLI